MAFLNAHRFKGVLVLVERDLATVKPIHGICNACIASDWAPRALLLEARAWATETLHLATLLPPLPTLAPGLEELHCWRLRQMETLLLPPLPAVGPQSEVSCFLAP